MPIRLFHLYQRKRVININVNATAAGLLAMIPAGGIVWLAEQSLPAEPHWPFSLIAVGADVIFDVIIYVILHWVANHWRPSTGKTEKDKKALGAKSPPFLRDVILIQIERAILSPIFYIVAGGLMHLLQIQGLRPSLAFLISFPAGLVATRLTHTIWGLRSGSFKDHDKREMARSSSSAGDDG